MSAGAIEKRGTAPLYFLTYRCRIRTKQKGSLRCTQILSDTVRRSPFRRHDKRKAVAPKCPKYESVCILIIPFFAVLYTLPRSTLGVSFVVPSFVVERVGWLPNNGFHGSDTRASGCLAQPSPTKRTATRGLVMYPPATRPVTRPNIVPAKSAHALPGA